MARALTSDGRGGQLVARFVPAVEAVRDLGATEWIAPRLLPMTRDVGTRTCAVVPQGFEAYARVFHPVLDRDGAPTTWADVAAWTGRTAHAGMQWEAITHPAPGRDAWPGTDEPRDGRPPSSLVRSLLAALLPHMTSAEGYLAVWEGWGDCPETNVTRLRLPGRGYVVVRGPLTVLNQSLWAFDDWPGPIDDACPSLWWPDDQAWIVATEVDFRWTYVAGSVAAVEAVLSDDTIEAHRVQPTDRHDLYGDAINPLPPR